MIEAETHRKSVTRTAVTRPANYSDVHPLANEILEDHQDLSAGSRTAKLVQERMERETLREEVAKPTSATRKRQMLVAWGFFLAWCAAILIVFAAISIVRGTFDVWSALVLLAIPLGILFTMPVWVAEEVKRDQDETVRRLGNAESEHRD